MRVIQSTFLLAILAANGFAGIQQYSNRAAWSDAVNSNATTIDFGIAAPVASGQAKSYPNGLTLSGVTFISTVAGNALNLVSQTYCCATYSRGYEQLTSAADGSGIMVTLPAGTTAFALDLFAVVNGNLTGTDVDKVDVTISGQKYTVTTPAAPGSAFFGVVSTTPISTVVITPQQTNGKTQADVMNFSYGTSATAGTTPIITSVLNAVDMSTNLSPGLLVYVYGSNFGSGTGSTVMATVGGKAAFVGPVASPAGTGQPYLEMQLPVDAPTGTNTMTVTVGGSTSAPFIVNLDAFAPAILPQIFGSNSVQLTDTNPAKPGDNLILIAVGLGPTNPIVPTGTSSAVQSPTVTQPTLTVGGVKANYSYSGSLPNQVGLYEIRFTVPAGLQGTQPVVLSIGGKSSSPASLPLAGISALVNNASFGSAGTVAPGSIASLFVNGGLGTTSQTTGFPATAFQGYSVLFNGIPAPLFHLVGSSGQIDLLVPYELPTTGTVALQLQTPSGISQTYTVSMAAAVPGIYYLADPSMPARLNALAQINPTAWLAMPDSMAAALKLPGNCKTNKYNVASVCGQPAHAGDYLVLYVTGLGKATPNGNPNGVQLTTGSIPPADGSVLYQTVAKPTVTVGGLPATVVFSGIAPGYPGLYQIDFQVPAGITGDDIPVAVSISGSPVDTRTISVQ